MKIVFMGTPDFAVPCIEKIYNDGHEIVGVFTQPDKPVGRSQKLTPPPVKQFAVEKNLTVYQPTSMKNGEAMAIIEKLNPDLIVVVAFGKILPKDIIDYPKYGCVNVHGSILPKYRGAAPIQWSVINGDEFAGVTTMLMNEGLDTGDILLVDKCKIGENDTSGDMYDKLQAMGAELLCKTIVALQNGTVTPQKQDDSKSCYASMLNKTMAQIDFSKSAREIHNLVRGLSPWPVAYTMLDGKTLKLHKTQLTSEKSTQQFGSVISQKPLLVVCGDGNVLQIDELQYEGKKRMKAQDFVCGHKIIQLGVRN